jgi:hypothetical protein
MASSSILGGGGVMSLWWRSTRPMIWRRELEFGREKAPSSWETKKRWTRNRFFHLTTWPDRLLHTPHNMVPTHTSHTRKTNSRMIPFILLVTDAGPIELATSTWQLDVHHRCRRYDISGQCMQTSRSRQSQPLFFLPLDSDPYVYI